MPRKDPSLSGQQVGRWTIGEELAPRNYERYYLCRCECGTARAVSHHHLKRGKTSSCGCLSKEVASTGRRVVITPGARFGRLTVLGEAAVRIHKEIAYRCLCECGTTRTLPSSRLRYGDTTSCGCYHRDRLREAATTHGLSRTAEHAIWTGMLNRCRNPRVKSYADYGGRGIAVCERWRSDFAAFYADMGPRPSPSHSIDRIDNNGPYSPENCRWSTPAQQAINTRRNRRVSLNGKTQTLSQWASDMGVTAKVLRGRLRRSGGIA